MTTENQGCLVATLKLFGINFSPSGNSGGSVSADDQQPYRLRDNFLSAAELSFFHVLRSAIKDQYIVTTKVRVSDLLYVVQRRSNMKHANKIDRKHVDFVLCDPRTMQPQLVIELDDSSHARLDRSDRDALVDAAFAAAEFPILHVPAQRAYSPEDIMRQIAGKIVKRSTERDPFNGVHFSRNPDVRSQAASCPFHFDTGSSDGRMP